MELHDVGQIRQAAEEAVAALRARINGWLPGLAVEHVGATALPDGLTKGDVDVALRPAAEDFEHVVEVLSAHFEVAQPENWRPTFASFRDPGSRLPLGVQVSVLGSDDDFLVAIRDRMLEDETSRAAYDRCKQAAAAGTDEDYWQAKNQFLQQLVDELRRQRPTSGAK